MLFKKGVIVQPKDTLSDLYIATIQEQKAKFKAKAREIQQCINNELAIEKKEETNGDNNTAL